MTDFLRDAVLDFISEPIENILDVEPEIFEYDNIWKQKKIIYNIPPSAREKHNAAVRKYYHSHKLEHRARVAKWENAHVVERVQYHIEYREKNREWINSKNRSRYAKKKREIKKKEINTVKF